MLGGQEEEGDQVCFMGLNRPNKMKDTVEQGSRVGTWCWSQWKSLVLGQRRQEEKLCTTKEQQSINQQEERVQLVTGCSGKNILHGLVIVEHIFLVI